VHLVGSIVDEGDVAPEAVGVSGQGVLFEQAEVGFDGHQRALEVVRDGVGVAF